MSLAMPLHICFFGYTLASSCGGDVTYVSGLAQKLVKSGYRVSIATKECAPAYAKISGVKYIALGRYASKNKSISVQFKFAYNALKFFATHKRFDCIHSISSSYLFAVLTILIRFINPAAAVHTLSHNIKVKSFYRLLDKLICSSRRIYARSPGNAVYIPYFVDLNKIKNAIPFRFRNKSSRIVAVIGPPNKRRGFIYFVRAIPLVQRRFPDAYFVMALDLNDIEFDSDTRMQLRKINNTIASYGLTNLKVIGQVDVARFMNSIDVLVYPVQTVRRLVDIPPTILEGMAGSGIVISTAKGAISEVIENQRNGLLINESDCQNHNILAGKITQVLFDKSLRTRMNRNAHQTVTSFNIESIYNEIEKVYRTVSV